MLDSQTIATVKSTIPLLAATGPKLTAHFYDRMFAHNPELKDIFNMSNQRNGDQRQALFDAICAYAANIENLAALLPAVERIAQKHTSFNIQPEQYQIVGGHLLATLDEMFSPGQEVLDAWGKAYGVLANVFIQRVVFMSIKLCGCAIAPALNTAPKAAKRRRNFIIILPYLYLL